MATETTATKLKRIEAKVDALTIKVDALTSPPPVVIPSKYILVDSINWSPDGKPILTVGQNLFPAELSEAMYFVITIDANGNLMGTSTTEETKFVSAITLAGKKATFCLGGGTQDKVALAMAVGQQINLINNIKTHMTTLGFSGVVLDFENTGIAPQVMADFINALRLSIGQDKILGLYTQPYQLTTVWSKLDQCINSVSWVSPMVYDYPNTTDQFKSDTLLWLSKVPKEKLLAGMAVNYDATGLDLNELPIILDWVNQQGLMGIGIWNNVLLTQPYRDIIKGKFTNI